MFLLITKAERERDYNKYWQKSKQTDGICPILWRFYLIRWVHFFHVSLLKLKFINWQVQTLEFSKSTWHMPVTGTSNHSLEKNDFTASRCCSRSKFWGEKKGPNYDRTCFGLVRNSLAAKLTICNLTMSSSPTKFFAIFRRTSGAIFGTWSEYSPISHRILALAIGTWGRKTWICIRWWTNIIAVTECIPLMRMTKHQNIVTYRHIFMSYSLEISEDNLVII